MLYVALLRGINVGGNNKVSMKELAELFETLSFTHIKTYINSGNIIFSSSEKSVTKLTTLIESALKRQFGFPIDVHIRTQAEIEKTVAAIPKNWVNDATMKCDVMFLSKQLALDTVVKSLPLKPGIDELLTVAGALIWKVDKDKVTRSGLMKIVGTQLYKNMTIRNCNTVRKLVTLMKEPHV